MELDYAPLAVTKKSDRTNCTVYRARASVIDISCSERNSVYEDYTPKLFVMGTPHEIALTEQEMTDYSPTNTAMCVEIVASRFLDSMVRTIVVSNSNA